MKRRFLLIIITMGLLSACSKMDSQAPAAPDSNMPTITAPAIETDAAPPLTDNEFIADGALNKEAIMASYKLNRLETAHLMAQLYVDSINSGVDLANNEDAIAMFDLLFNRQTLTIGELSAENNMEDGYICDISGSGPKGERTVPLLIIFQDENPRFFCPLAYYGKLSRLSAENYIKFLAEGDAAKLSQWLSIDGEGDEFIDESNKLIDYYSKYDMATAEIVGFDYDSDKYRFIYTVKDANNVEFEIYLIYGDGFSMPDTAYDLERLTEGN